MNEQARPLTGSDLEHARRRQADPLVQVSQTERLLLQEVDRLRAVAEEHRQTARHAYYDVQALQLERERLEDEVDRLRARLASFDFEDCVSIGSQQVRIAALEDELSRLRAENTTQGVLGEIAAERAAQDAKWGEQNHPDGTGVHFAEIVDADVAKMACQDAADGGYLDWLHILREEVAEAFAESNPVALRAELIQVAAVAVAWVEAIDRRALGLVQDGGR